MAETTPDRGEIIYETKDTKIKFADDARVKNRELVEVSWMKWEIAFFIGSQFYYTDNLHYNNGGPPGDMYNMKYKQCCLMM